LVHRRIVSGKALGNRRAQGWALAIGQPSVRQVIEWGERITGGGAILEIDPPRLLVYTWHANWHDDPSLATVVRWELQPDDNGTKVKVTHSGLAKEKPAREDYSGGWTEVVKLLKEFVEK
jgi:uncharacterized protein YndB with AHSA1/START domain